MVGAAESGAEGSGAGVEASMAGAGKAAGAPLAAAVETEAVAAGAASRPVLLAGSWGRARLVWGRFVCVSPNQHLLPSAGGVRVGGVWNAHPPLPCSGVANPVAVSSVAAYSFLLLFCNRLCHGLAML